MLTIDSQIWIYYFDANAKENANVANWFEGKNQDGILFTEKIVLSSIIPIEVAHNLFKISQIDRNEIEDLIISLISLDHCQLIEINQTLIFEALSALKKYSPMGIGGRDALIIATMEICQIKTIATHDKNLLSLKELKRIDPIFDPPMEINPGEDFDSEKFKIRVREQL
ncbi:MAG: type II toxin-antitoxin system VapC family toxin [Candidatus Heimdallarchaeota archaeon]